MGEARDLFALVGTTIAEKYRIDRVLGEGGFGVVYEGAHLLLGARIAVKCMKPLGATSEDERRTTDLFLREARVLFSLTHPGIVRLYDLGTLSAQMRTVPYVVLELLAGHSLEADIARRAATTPRRAFEATELRAVFEPVLEALAFAHARGVVHRDLKPSNVMLVEEAGVASAKVVDFGVSRWAGDQATSTGMGAFTPRYAAPEQWDSSLGALGPATDVFALGLMIAEACTLEPALEGTTPTQILASVMKPGRRVDLLGKRPDLPHGLDAIVARATSVDPSARHPSAKELLDDLRAALSGTPIALAPSSMAATMPVSSAGADSAMVSAPTMLAPSTPRAIVSAPPSAVLATGATADPMSKSLATTARNTRLSLGVALASAAVAVTALVAVVVVLATRRSEVPRRSNPAHASASIAPAASSAHPEVKARVGALALFAGDAFPAGKLDALREEHIGDFRACYRAALHRDGSIQGEVALLVAIEFNGKVFSVTDMDEGLDDPDLVRDATLRACIVDAVKRWPFPTTTKTSDVDGVLLLVDLRRASDPPANDKTDAPLAGVWNTDFSLLSLAKIFHEKATIVQRGRRLVGDYEDGTFACNVEDKRLLCAWVQTDSSGRAVLARIDASTMKGTWGYGPSDSDAGPWSFKKIKP